METARLLLERGCSTSSSAVVDLNHQEYNNGMTALFMAAEIADVALVELLLSYHADITIRDKVIVSFVLYFLFIFCMRTALFLGLFDFFLKYF